MTENKYTFQIGDEDNYNNKNNNSNNENNNEIKKLTIEDAPSTTRFVLNWQASRNTRNKILAFLACLLIFPLHNYVIIGVGILNVPAIGIVLGIWGPFIFTQFVNTPTPKMGTPFHDFLFQNKRTLERFNKTVIQSAWGSLFNILLVGSLMYAFIAIPLLGTTAASASVESNDIIVIAFMVTYVLGNILMQLTVNPSIVLIQLFAEYRMDRIRAYITSIQNTMLDPEIGTDGILKRLTNEQRKAEKFGSQVNKGLSSMYAGGLITAGSWIMILLVCAALISTSTRENKLRSLSFNSFFIFLFLLLLLMQMYQITAPSRAWNGAVQEQLNDASLAPVINKIFGRRVDFDKWLNSHEISSQRVFGSKVSLQRLSQVGSVLISGVLIVIYFVMREELRNLI